MWSKISINSSQQFTTNSNNIENIVDEPQLNNNPTPKFYYSEI